MWRTYYISRRMFHNELSMSAANRLIFWKRNITLFASHNVLLLNQQRVRDYEKNVNIKFNLILTETLQQITGQIIKCFTTYSRASERWQDSTFYLMESSQLEAEVWNHLLIC